MNQKQAFPISQGGVEGMTLRDYFAAKALASIIISDVYSVQQRGQQDQAKQAYNYADAMLEARGK